MSKIYDLLNELSKQEPVRGPVRSVLYRLDWEALLFCSAVVLVWTYIGWLVWTWARS